MFLAHLQTRQIPDQTRKTTRSPLSSANSIEFGVTKAYRSKIVHALHGCEWDSERRDKMAGPDRSRRQRPNADKPPIKFTGDPTNRGAINMNCGFALCTRPRRSSFPRLSLFLGRRIAIPVCQAGCSPRPIRSAIESPDITWLATFPAFQRAAPAAR